MIVLETIFWISLLAVVGTYFIYPVSLVVLARFRHRQQTPDALFPSVTLIISAYNEAQVIAKKIENALALEYPHDRLEIMVISDASDDSTDETVRRYASQGVVLHRAHRRQGKSSGLTQFVSRARGEIIVFSDANSMYEPSALGLLVRHFHDPRVGYVVGCQRYSDGEGSPAETSEGLYWRYELFLKRFESKVSSVVGGDGAIYAIRSQLFQPLKPDDISDFVNPLQIVEQGYRGVFEPAAVCYESAAGSFEGEFRRKVRIVNRSLTGLLRVPRTMNPYFTGWFAYQVVVHKLLRWFVPLFLVAMLGASSVLAWRTHQSVYQVFWWMQITLYATALLCLVPGLRQHKIVYISSYFCVVNMAAGLGILTSLFGKRFSIWKPERQFEMTDVK